MKVSYTQVWQVEGGERSRLRLQIVYSLVWSRYSEGLNLFEQIAASNL